MDGNGSSSGRVVLIDDQDKSLPFFPHREPPINDSVPLPEGVTSLEQWSQTMITMRKYAGRTFGQLLDAIKSGDRDVIQYSSWLVHSYSRHITRRPRSQAPDLRAFLLRSGFDSYTRTYGSYRPAWWGMVLQSQMVWWGLSDSVSDGWRLLRFGSQMSCYERLWILHGWMPSALGLVCSGFNDAIPFW